MTTDCLLQLRSLLTQLDGAAGLDEVGRLCKELLKIGRRWPEEVLEEEAKAFERLRLQLMKFADSQQQDIVAAFRPLREDVRRRMLGTTAALNGWLAEAPHPEKASPQRLAELLQAIEDAPQMRWYKQCTDLRIKAQFLVAMASVIRATSSAGALLKAHVAKHPQAAALVQRLAERFFVVPEHGDVLETWHAGRLEYYNATLWRAAKRAADRLKDDLQVRLVSALRRATAPVQPVLTGGKAKPQLQLELHQWPMVSCPLARAFLDFVAQRGSELGDLGQPSLSECPPHSLLPATLRKLLGRLDAFEVLDDEGTKAGGQGEKLGIVRLRWEAVAALAFKAVGTKPKAASLAAAGGGKPPVPESSVPKAAAAPARAQAPRDGAAEPEAREASPGAASPKLVVRKLDWSNAYGLLRLVRRGLRAPDDDWRVAWQLFCKQKRAPADLSQAPPREVVAEFVERNLQALLKKPWARDLMYKPEGRGDELPPDSDRDDGPSPAADGEGLRPRPKDAAQPRKRGSCSRDSSSASESSRSKQRRKRRKKEKRKMGLMGYGDYFGRGQSDLHISPEVMMMNQMMGMSMMMNNPLAMMGMGAPMMTHQMQMMPTATGMKLKKDDKSKREKPEDKLKKDGRDRDRKEKPEPARDPAAAKALLKDAKIDWSKRKEAMIDADDL
mmetsp:Transcript_100667/g.285265  ORF Transcript_100667/g.285265 Transcript_100667/m.285265 type:complete len:670 (-) Transcript_100667:216-2225(-)